MWRTARHLGAVGAALALCWELIEQGGIRVQTPPAPAAPLIVTTVQLDGDVVTLVNPALFQHQSDTWINSGQQHAAAVRAAVASLFCLPDALRAAHAALFAAITLVNWAVLASILLSLPARSSGALAELAGAVAVQAGLLFAWPAIRRTSSWAVGLGLRRRFSRMAEDWQSESRKALPGLRARRAARRAAQPPASAG